MSPLPFPMTEHTTPVPVSVEEIGPLARLLRKERGLTLDQASAVLGVTISALSRAERGEASVYRLALRSANVHLDGLAAAGHYTPGRVEERVQAVGGAIAAVARLRGPETDRRAALLRQALLARGVYIERADRFVFVRLAEDTVAVDLPTTLILVWPGRPNAGPDDKGGRTAAGSIVDIGDLAVGLSAEEWAVVVDRFAEALVAASAGGPLDLELLRDGVRRSSRETLTPGGAPSTVTGAPIED